ncbi:hypothetical protein POPTR_012G119350v4 [Populus trichocarpa]|uniref:Uncharacterized protein n=1 Tax=Populus trichocarpa TaxID=3694 RepID=A0ACC0S7V3_POPTR|nr:hypothetical protein BDE02_12G097200 [Populus trichocarpa]KAI9384846.1 hypothetical protein POPTR_012G119350v4 [Populus trichocarpa]
MLLIFKSDLEWIVAELAAEVIGWSTDYVTQMPEHHCRSHPYHSHSRNQFKICSLNVLV